MKLLDESPSNFANKESIKHALRPDFLPPLDSLAGCIQLTAEQAASYLYKTEQTLAVWRCTKRYPLPYIKIGRSIRYRVSDIREFLEANIVDLGGVAKAGDHEDK